ncbi:MAG: potassium channel protein [Oscillatoria sp. SIO1A7]|nr:potassium channel protein [Oscillatoria sp. SIO1A7]
MKPRIIVCGLGRTGYKIFCLLRQQGAFVVGISDRPIPGESTDVVIGELRSASTLLAAGIQEAHTLTLTNNDDATNLEILMQARILNPKIRIISRLFNTSLGDRLDRTLLDHTSMSVSALAAPVFAFAALGNKAIGQLSLYNKTWPIHEEYIDEQHPWNGREISDLWAEPTRMLIYYLSARQKMDLVSAVVQGQTLEAGDRLIIATQPLSQTQKLSWRQKLLKTLANWRRIEQHSRSTAMVVLALLLTIFVATLTYTCINLETSFVDSLYFSVGMITGAGGNEKVAESAPQLIKVFTAIMMLVGAGVIGICYALLNDFILGTRFRQLLKAPPIPDGDHYIVCGLGGIGIQTIKQLRANGYEVVAIERDKNCRFLSTAHALKIPVIQADATIPATLESAKIKTCKALLAVTSNDTINLEIALSAKGIVPKLVVVRNHDPHFALMVQKVFEFESVLSPTEIAAPSFAAAALGGRICGNGMTGGNLWVALATLITPAHPFCNDRVKDAAMKSDFVPLYIENHSCAIHGWELLEYRLVPGDVLHLTILANRLDQLWRTTPSEANEAIVASN